GMNSFFFQAEDGIRDFHVTGVQTCALPISPVCIRRAGFDAGGPHSVVRWAAFARGVCAGDVDLPAAGGDRRVAGSSADPGGGRRSEERRVGKQRGRRKWLLFYCKMAQREK